MDELFGRVLFAVFVAPFWLGYHAIRLTCIGIASLFRAHQRSQLHQQMQSTQQEIAELERQDHMQRQQKLAEAPPVDKMTARLEVSNGIVELYLQFSEEERAIIIRNDLDQIVFEDRPKYTKEALARYRADETLTNNASQETVDGAFELLKQERVRVRLIDYMAYPYQRVLDSPHEAAQYSAELKKILPKIKELIENARNAKSSETIRL